MPTRATSKALSSLSSNSPALTGDRSRDLDEHLRSRALDALRSSSAPDSWRRLILEVVKMETADQAKAFGDTLPAGLAV